MLVKICGITGRDDAVAARDAGADALGFNFWPKSPRYISPEAAACFVPDLGGVLKVGVFVNAEAEQISAVARLAGLDIVQLHGTFDPPPGARAWKALAVKTGFDSASLEGADAYLLDAPSGEEYGGTGRTFDWNLIRGLQRRIVLAGGLDASNVAEAIRTAQPWGVDACSRLESSPGKKDHHRVAAFCKAVLEAVP